jgi:hypothetical protein
VVTWKDAYAEAPELATAVRQRFEATGLGFLATLRADGSPRISGIEPSFWNEDVWLGMMWDSRKALDLRRDARLSVHAASIDKQVEAGDARISGRGIEVDDDAIKLALGAALAEKTEFDPNEHGPWHLFKVDVEEVYFLKPGGDHLVLEWWTPSGGRRRIERR